MTRYLNSIIQHSGSAARSVSWRDVMKMNRLCPECGIGSCRIEINTFLDSVYCQECVTRFEYPTSTRKFVGLIFSFVSFLSALLLFYIQSLLITFVFILAVMIPTLYLAAWHTGIKIAGVKGIRKRIRERRS